MSLSPERFRHAMGHLASGVTVVTVRAEDGRAHGMTATAVASLSLEPPMLLVCVDRGAEIHDLIVRAPAFGVNVLAEDQEPLARRFAERDRHAFGEGDARTSPAGLPLVAGALAHLDCRRTAVHAGGDHSVVAGTVEWAETRDGPPLCYFRSSYLGLSR